jgi:hypothetical protein
MCAHPSPEAAGQDALLHVALGLWQHGRWWFLMTGGIHEASPCAVLALTETTIACVCHLHMHVYLGALTTHTAFVPAS